MIIDLRRAHREVDFLPITVNAVNGVDGETLAGPFSCSILDISNSGACLLITQVLINRYHIFHSTKENDSNLLQLLIRIPPEKELFTITARPVWMNKYRNKEIKAFKLGIEFMTSPQGKQIRQLEEALRENRPERRGWWQKFS